MRYFLITICLLLSVMFAKGQTYFQQEVNTQIDVELDDENHQLKAFIRMEYINHSDSTLNKMYIHLWPNAYANDETALAQQLFQMEMTDFYFSDESQKGRISNLDFTIDKIPHRYSYYEGHIDIAEIKLSEPLMPGDTIWIETPFEVKIPSNVFSRLGHDGNSYQITQWFPKPAVFDRKGWHPMPYLNMGEFYSEFGDYDVHIRVPVDYRVAASGQLQTPSELKWLMDMSGKASVVGHPYGQDSTHKTLHYHLENAHDFAWFADPAYLVRHKETILNNGHKVHCWAFYLKKNKTNWNDALKYLERSIAFYSEHVGAYPYANVTAVDGTLAAGGGMEYPTITIVGSETDEKGFEEVLMHEVGHNWFYGMLGFNEREQPWLDEGLNSFYQNLYMSHYYPNDYVLQRIFGSFVPDRLFGQNTYPAQYQSYLGYQLLAMHDEDLPMNLSSEDFGMYAYYIGVYMKPVVYLYHLREYLGHSEWESIMKSFFYEWKFKHPQEEDFVHHLENHATKDVRWFTQQALSSGGILDYKIAKVRREGEGYNVTVKKKGEVEAPVLLTGVNAEGQIVYSNWIDSVGKKQQVFVDQKEVTRFELNKGFLNPDGVRRNNDARSRGLFRTLNDPLPKFLYGLPQTNHYPNYWVPLYGWNALDRNMFGLALYNDWGFEKAFHYRLQPLYSFHSNTLLGLGELYYNVYTTTRVQRVSLGLKASRYAHQEAGSTENDDSPLAYTTVKPLLEVRFRPKAYQRKLQNRLTLSWNYIRLERDAYYSSTHSTSYSDYDFMKLSYLYAYPRTVNPFAFQTQVESNLDRWKLSTQLDYFLTYDTPKKGLRLRFFGGVFMGNGSLGYAEAFRLGAWRGKEDYLYDHLFLNRADGVGNGLWSQQMTIAEGGFAVPAFQRSEEWITSLNLSTSLFLPSFIRIYGSLAIMPDYNNEVKGYYETGVCLSIWKQAVEVYFPVLWSEEIRKTNALNQVNTYPEHVRFAIDFNRINPFDYLRHFKL